MNAKQHAEVWAAIAVRLDSDHFGSGYETAVLAREFYQAIHAREIKAAGDMALATHGDLPTFLDTVQTGHSTVPPAGKEKIAYD